jgi:putative salt-induced outer membrane protein YdiY
MKTAYLVKYDNQPVAGLAKTDSIISIALVANF